MAWTDRRENFDDVEWQNMELLKRELPAYLEFHEQDQGHLPKTSLMALGLLSGRRIHGAKRSIGSASTATRSA